MRYSQQGYNQSSKNVDYNNINKSPRTLIKHSNDNNNNNLNGNRRRAKSLTTKNKSNYKSIDTPQIYNKQIFSQNGMNSLSESLNDEREESPSTTDSSSPIQSPGDGGEPILFELETDIISPSKGHKIYQNNTNNNQNVNNNQLKKINISSDFINNFNNISLNSSNSQQNFRQKGFSIVNNNKTQSHLNNFHVGFHAPNLSQG